MYKESLQVTLEVVKRPAKGSNAMDKIQGAHKHTYTHACANARTHKHTQVRA